MGLTTLIVVPGATVLSTQTRAPLRSCLPDLGGDFLQGLVARDVVRLHGRLHVDQDGVGVGRVRESSVTRKVFFSSATRRISSAISGSLSGNGEPPRFSRSIFQPLRALRRWMPTTWKPGDVGEQHGGRDADVAHADDDDAVVLQVSR